MSVLGLTKEITDLLSSFEKGRESIHGNKMYSDTKKVAEISDLSDKVWLKFISLLTGLWGSIIPDDDAPYSNTLSPDGEIWKAFDSDQRRLTAVKDRWMKSRYSNPDLLVLIESRAKTIVLNSDKNGLGVDPTGEFWRLYESADSDTRCFLQDCGGSLLQGKNGDWPQVASRLERQRQEALDKATEALEKAADETMDNAVAAYQISKRIADLFAVDGGYIATFTRGIFYRRTTLLGARVQYEIDRVRWTDHHINFKAKVLHFGA